MLRIGIAALVFTLLPASAQTPLDTAANSAVASKEGKFTGSPITLKLKDADVHEVLRLIGETSGFNVIIHPQVTGKISLSLDQVPWDQALDIVLSTLKLGAERNESVLRILPRDALIAEKQQELETKKLAIAAAPRVTRVFPISYADLTQLSQLLQTFANAQLSTGGPSSGTLIPPATIIIDNTTQSLVVRDTVENIDKIRKMIQILDVQTPQVMIEAKVVEASESFTKSIGGSFGIGGASLKFGANGQQSLAGSTATLGDTAGNGTFAGATLMNIGTRAMPSMLGINAAISAGERLKTVKVVSSPRTVVLSGKQASITQSRAFAIPLITPGTNNNPSTTQLVSVSANTRLNVTPRVTNDGSVFMKLDLSRDILNLDDIAAPVAEPRNMTTEVIVESGNTLVIGGVLNIDENNSESGMPFLRKLPLIGGLFGAESKIKAKSELMFFVTPRILNQKRTALSDEDMKKL